MSTSFDLKNIEEIVERVLRKVRSEELKLIAEAVKTLADYMKTGFKEALERIVSIEERIEKIGERLEEHSKILQEHSKRLEELMLIIQEHSKILREHSKRLEELTAIISDQNRRIGEYLMVLLAHSKKIEELTRAISEFKITLGSIGRRWGRDLEETVIRLYRHVLEERGVIPEKIERFVYEDKEGRYYVKGSRIEFDMYVHDDRVYLIEVKSHADRNDVEWFYKRAEIYEKITSRKPDKLILIAVNIDVGAYERARELGMDVIYGSLIP